MYAQDWHLGLLFWCTIKIVIVVPCGYVRATSFLSFVGILVKSRITVAGSTIYCLKSQLVPFDNMIVCLMADERAFLS